MLSNSTPSIKHRNRNLQLCEFTISPCADQINLKIDDSSVQFDKDLRLVWVNWRASGGHCESLSQHHLGVLYLDDQTQLAELIHHGHWKLKISRLKNYVFVGNGSCFSKLWTAELREISAKLYGKWY
jgi:hypothetical protein